MATEKTSLLAAESGDTNEADNENLTQGAANTAESSTSECITCASFKVHGVIIH